MTIIKRMLECRKSHHEVSRGMANHFHNLGVRGYARGVKKNNQQYNTILIAPKEMISHDNTPKRQTEI